MNDVVEISEVASIRRKNDGLHPQASRRFIVTRPGEPVRAPLAYLDSRTVHPYLVDHATDSVWFLETAEPVDHDKVSFSYEHVQDKVVRLLRVPAEAFLAYQPEAQHNTGRDLVFLHHPGRCGSTLAHKLLGSHPQIIAYSEHLILNNVMDAARPERSARLLRAMVRFLQTHSPTPEAPLTVFKLAQKGKEAYECYSAVFPDARHLYLTRDPVKVALSYVDLANKINGGKTSWLGRLAKRIPRVYSESTLISLEFFKPDETVKRLGAGPALKCNWLEALVLDTLIKDRYFHRRAHLPSVCCMDYEELIDFERFKARLGPFFGLDMGLVDRAHYGRHSQEGSIAEMSDSVREKTPESVKAALRAFVDEMAVVPL